LALSVGGDHPPKRRNPKKAIIITNPGADASKGEQKITPKIK
jgi:hypothetical protein